MSTTQSLSTRAMLVNLSITTWTARKYDKKVTAEVAHTHAVSETAGRYNKSLLPADSPSYKAVLQASNAARTAHYEQTLPWSDEGSRILPATNFMEYSQQLRKLHDTFDSAVVAFIADYPTLQANAQHVLNGLYNPTDYPTVSELQSKFSFASKILPLPDASDFRVSLGDDDVQEIRMEIENNVSENVRSATTDLYQRLFTVVSKMVERLNDKEAIFRDSLVDNARELCDLLPRLNLMNDSALETLRVRVESELAVFDAGELRDSKALRAEIARKAASIQTDMAAIMGI